AIHRLGIRAPLPHLALHRPLAGGGDALAAASSFMRTEGIRRVRPVTFWSGVLETVEYGPKPLGWEFDMHDKMLAVTPEQITAAAKKWLSEPTDKIEIIAFKERKPIEQTEPAAEKAEQPAGK
ncbi:MAG TPA: hypothetical protein PLQ76_07790, partial [bacterium]|nr:hypothetical protein [bacterium]